MTANLRLFEEFAAAEDVVLSRSWAMPDKWTFNIPPIAALLRRYVGAGLWVDPFAGRYSPAAITNDLNPDMPATFHMDAIDFLRDQPDASADGVLFDPPYSPRQIAEVYASVGRQASTEDTQAAFWGRCKAEIARIVKPGGTAITCGWNSGGIGQERGFRAVEILLVAHGGWHNDTIVTVEVRNPGRANLFEVPSLPVPRSRA